MSELITVFLVLGLLVVAWFALCIDVQGVKEGIKMATGIPVMIATVLAIIAHIVNSFSVVFGNA
jgi:hypothetical protein